MRGARCTAPRKIGVRGLRWGMGPAVGIYLALEKAPPQWTGAAPQSIHQGDQSFVQSNRVIDRSID